MQYPPERRLDGDAFLVPHRLHQRVQELQGRVGMQCLGIVAL